MLCSLALEFYHTGDMLMTKRVGYALFVNATSEYKGTLDNVYPTHDDALLAIASWQRLHEILFDDFNSLDSYTIERRETSE